MGLIDIKLYFRLTFLCGTFTPGFYRIFHCQMVKGIKTYVFSPPSDVFASPDENPDNEGFCEPKPCLGGGLLRVSNCRHDAPLVISQPHLCDADEEVQKTISGIKPDPTKHKTQLFVEPNIGALAEVWLEFNFGHPTDRYT